MILRRSPLLLLLLLAACVPTSAIVPIDSLSQLDASNVLVVGRIVLHPGLAADEQDLGESYEEFRNMAVIVTDGQLRDASELRYGDFGERIDAPFDQFFTVGHSRKSFFLLRGWVIMRARFAMGNDGVPEYAPLDGTFRVDVRPDDRAIYIGTIHYYRDDFFSTERIEVRDDFKDAQAFARKKFGTDVSLRKSLAVPVPAR